MDIAKIKQQLVSDPQVRDLVARRAFEIYVHRQGGPGSAAEDWLRAESEILPRLVDEIVARNRTTNGASAPTVKDAATHVRQEGEAAETAAKPAAKPARKAPARKTAAKPAAEAAEEPKAVAKPRPTPTAKAAAKPAAKKTPAKKAATTKPEGSETPAAEAVKKPARKSPAKKA
jgi:hypothetical protein